METAEYLYRILAFAQHTENDEKLVIYQALYPPYKTCARPYDMFCSEVDREKYPNAKQKLSLIHILENGLTCTTDPECFMKNPTTDRINGAACHSCTMISETACENGNRLLDRALVVPLPEHEEMGYFKELVNVLCGIQV